MERRRTIPSRRTGRIVKDSTISRQLCILSALFGRLVKTGVVQENPCRQVEWPSGSDARERAASSEDIARLKLVAGWEEGEVPVTKT